jgi:hypothetical protein
MILADQIQFAADVLRRLQDTGQDAAGDKFFKLGIEHAVIIADQVPRVQPKSP